MLTSDVTARGIDIPDVTAVVQVGMPSNGEQCMYFLLPNECLSQLTLSVSVFGIQMSID